jgi:hypothetical protein
MGIDLNYILAEGGVSSRVLFDLEKDNSIFENDTQNRQIILLRHWLRHHNLH